MAKTTTRAGPRREFFPFLTKKTLSSSNKQFSQCLRREAKQHKDHDPSLREMRLQNSNCTGQEEDRKAKR